jgi:hypothetical protein
VRTFAILKEPRLTLLEWVRRHNESALLERHCSFSPNQCHRALLQEQAI